MFKQSELLKPANHKITTENNFGSWSMVAYSGQSYKASKSINYDSRVILTNKVLIFTTVGTSIVILGTL